MTSSTAEHPVRLDKWLWAARFYKTRSLASDAINGGKVHVNGARAKPSRTVRLGDEIRITKDIYQFIITVIAASDTRGPASVATTLYAESAQSQQARLKLAEQVRAQQPANSSSDHGKPSKKSRRQIIRFLRQDHE